MSLSIDSEFKFLGDSVEGVAVKNETSLISFKLPDSYVVYGAQLITDSTTFGDYISLSVVDMDNILGLGENVIVSQWLSKWFVPTGVREWKIVSEFGGTVLKDLYLRLSYTNVSLDRDTNLKINFFLLSR